MSGRGRFNTRSSAQNQNYNQNQNAKTPYKSRNTNTYSTPTYSTPTGHQQQKEPQQPAVQPPLPPQQVTPQQVTPQRQPAQQAQTPAYQQPPVQQKVEASMDVATPKDAPPAALLKPDEDAKMDEVEGEEGKKRTRKWSRRTPDFKIPRRIRKRRQNARLKNLLAPKNAMMVLNELHPELKMVIIEQPNVHNQTAYTVEIELDGKIYQGMGISKMAAKQAGSEAALKAVLLKKLEENNVKDIQQSAANKAEGGFDVRRFDEDVSMTDASGMKEPEDDQSSQNGGPKLSKHIPEDDVPWGSLASFALYKLFSEWQSQGFHLPAASGLQYVAASNKAQIPPAGPTPMKNLPDDANQKHPVQLLNQLRPASQYVETREGMPPNLTFTYTVKVDNLTFKGVGNSKKEAKKECAKHALEHMGVVYSE